MNNFELHQEKRIGFKLLSKADLGTGDTSGQTHIGLSEKVLTYLGNHVESPAYLVFNNLSFSVVMNLDWIFVPSTGKYRSPKIRMGNQGSQSLVRKIREIAQTDLESNWYLIWFGLSTGTAVFILLNQQSQNFEKLNNFIDLNNFKMSVFDSENPKFYACVKNIKDLFNNAVYDVEQVLIDVQTLPINSLNRKYTQRQIDEANRIYNSVGRAGEVLIDRYFKKMTETGEIESYEWPNRDGEGFQPFDFSYKKKGEPIVYVDVKTTGNDFTKPMIFSYGEIRFANKNPNTYKVFRVFGIDNLSDPNSGSFCICSDIKNLFDPVINSSNDFEKHIKEYVELLEASFAVEPRNASLTFSDVKTLHFSESGLSAFNDA